MIYLTLSLFLCFSLLKFLKLNLISSVLVKIIKAKSQTHTLLKVLKWEIYLKSSIKWQHIFVHIGRYTLYIFHICSHVSLFIFILFRVLTTHTNDGESHSEMFSVFYLNGQGEKRKQDYLNRRLLTQSLKQKMFRQSSKSIFPYTTFIFIPERWVIKTMMFSWKFWHLQIGASQLESKPKDLLGICS